MRIFSRNKMCSVCSLKLKKKKKMLEYDWVNKTHLKGILWADQSVSYSAENA